MENIVHAAALAELREKMDSWIVEPPEAEAFHELLQKQFETVAIRRDDDEPWGTGNRQKVRGILLTGQPRVGKTELAENAANGLLDIATAAGDIVTPKHFTVECPSIFTHGLLFNEVLVRMGYVSRPLPRTAAWTRIEQKLSVYRSTLLILDECQNAFRPTGVGKKRINNVNLETAGVLRRLLDHPDWPLPLLLVGLPEMINVLLQEDMAPLRERIDIIELKPMKDTLDEATLLLGAIQNYCRLATVEYGIAESDFYRRLIHASGHARGLAIQLAKDAVVNAWRGVAKRLTVNDFTICYRNSTGAADVENPFVVTNWNQTDRSRLLDAVLEVSPPILQPRVHLGR